MVRLENYYTSAKGIRGITLPNGNIMSPEGLYREVQLDLTPEIEVFFMLFERDLSIFSMTSPNSIFPKKKSVGPPCIMYRADWVDGPPEMERS